MATNTSPSLLLLVSDSVCLAYPITNTCNFRCFSSPAWSSTAKQSTCLLPLFSHNKKWLRRHAKGDTSETEHEVKMFASDDQVTTQIPTQAQSLVGGSGETAVLVSEYKPSPDMDYLQELLAIQQQGPRSIGFFGTRNMGFMHQELIEILSYAMVITKNHIFTSGASGTNAAVIRGALRAEKPELLTVILPQSLKMQPPESQELLSKVKNVIEKPYNDHLPLIEASRLCNMDIISHVQQVICFAFHDSRLLMETCQEAKNLRKIVTLFYLD
ncbi:Thiamine-phosphate synthase [Heracleum sosnowskyi]|uniref:Thiamine-phosphate synthase n=1 Tax=Heracleum sosnowskyi TaxID=360622 RepID=A0AAD8M0R0_9APIA|nr:Thiamine-phosphate synthase [Heracleum sosnowskyi]